MILSRVDLPEPLVPTSATCSRSLSWNVMPEKMISVMKRLLTSWTVRMVVAMVVRMLLFVSAVGSRH
jgi:hypothetical protein